jgi:hypothetical protein
LPDQVMRVSDRPSRDRDRAGAAGSAADPDAASRGQAEAPDLEAEETLLVVLRGIGAMMFLTTHRLIVARDGNERRPRSGVASHPLETIRQLHLELGSGPSGRVAIGTEPGKEAVSMFFDARSLDRARELIDTARPHIARRRRRGHGDRPVRPPSGPADSGPSGPG